MLNASALLGQSAGALAIRNPWSGAARLTRGAIAHQSNFYKTFYKNSISRFENLTTFKTYTFATVQSENTSNGPKRQCARAVSADFSGQVLATAWVGVNPTANGYTTGTTDMCAVKSAGADAVLVQCMDSYNGSSWIPLTSCSTDGVTFNWLPVGGGYVRRFTEANGRVFGFDNPTAGSVFTQIFSATTAAFAAAPTIISWTTGALPSSGNWEKLIYGNGRWLCIAPRQMKIAYSLDGTTWGEYANFTSFCNVMFVAGNLSICDFRFDGTNFILTTVNGGRIETFYSSTGEFWTPLGMFYLDDHQIEEISGNLVNGPYPRSSPTYASQDMATPPVYYNGQWFFKVKASVPARTMIASGTSGWETEFLVSTPDFVVWNKHPDHYVGQRSRDTTTPNSAIGWYSDRANGDAFQNYSIGGVYSIGGTSPPVFNTGATFGGQASAPMLIADTTSAREVYYAL